MSRDIGLYLDDIEIACQKVLRFTAGCTFKQFSQDDEKFDAVLRNLETIGEAIKHIPDEIQRQYPLVKWRKIAGFRDIVAHHYFGVSEEIVWDVVENEIPELLKQIKEILRNL